MFEIIIHYVVGFLMLGIIVYLGQCYIKKYHGRHIGGEVGVSLHGLAIPPELKKYLGEKASEDSRSNISLGKP